MKYLAIFAILLTVTAFAADTIEITSVAQSNYSDKAAATLPGNIIVNSPSGISALVLMKISGELHLEAATVLVRESFMSQASLEDFLRSRFCGEMKPMKGEFYQIDKAGGFSDPKKVIEAKISLTAKTTHVSYKGAKSSGEKVDSWLTCK